MIKKQFLKTKCKVTFELVADSAQDFQTAYLVGDFNNWNEQSLPMEAKKNNKFTISVNLEPNQEYEYRYLINGNRWQNDPEADKYVSNPFHGENSVLSTYQSDPIGVQ